MSLGGLSQSSEATTTLHCDGTHDAIFGVMPHEETGTRRRTDNLLRLIYFRGMSNTVLGEKSKSAKLMVPAYCLQQAWQEPRSSSGSCSCHCQSWLLLIYMEVLDIALKASSTDAVQSGIVSRQALPFYVVAVLGSQTPYRQLHSLKHQHQPTSFI